ncbi:MAG: indole-3-glycerol phosphate synthase TrpC [Nitrospirota bacterium]
MILDEIVTHKRNELKDKKIRRPFSELKRRVINLEGTRDLSGAISRGKDEPLKLIAEIKKASPSKGVIRERFEPSEIALTYEDSGASAISVLTEKKFFMGDIEHLSVVRRMVKLPLLRKDFIFDTYQIYESRLYGADAVLLIAEILTRQMIEDLIGISKELDMDCLVETHHWKEMDKALLAGAEIIGINNRNLDTLSVDINTTFNLIKDIPDDRVVVSESGIKTKEDIKRLRDSRIDAVLIGTVFMEADDIGKKVEELMGVKP